MKKLLNIVLSFVFMLSGSISYSVDINKAWNITEISASSGQVAINTRGYVYVKSITLSTGTAVGADWAKCFSTVAAQNATYAALNTTGSSKTPAMVFQTTATYGSVNSANTSKLTWDNPIAYSTGCFCFKTNANSGEALKMYVEWSY